MAATLVVALTAGPAGGQDARTLRIAIPADYGPLSPYAPDSLAAPLGLVLDTLFTTPYAAEPEPLLATSAEPVPGSGNRTWTIELRRGVRWHDGRPFTAQDVKFSFDYYRDGPPNGITHHASLAPILERTEVVGEHTVRTTCAQPCPFLRDVTLAFLPIVAAHQWREVEDPLEFDGTLLGTGPYRLPGPTERTSPGDPRWTVSCSPSSPSRRRRCWRSPPTRSTRSPPRCRRSSSSGSCALPTCGSCRPGCGTTPS
jgi:peptide/nickel transport system substrate-binding protein